MKREAVLYRPVKVGQLAFHECGCAVIVHGLHDDARTVVEFKVVADEVTNVVLRHETGGYYIGTRGRRCIYSGYPEFLGAHRDHARTATILEVAVRGAQGAAMLERDGDVRTAVCDAHAPYEVVFADEACDEGVGRTFVQFIRRRKLLHHAVVEYGNAV